MVSFDCFIQDFKINFFGSSEFIMKGFLSCFTPIVFVVTFSGVWAGWKIIRANKVDFKRYVVISGITILLFFHPTLTEKTLSLFKCISIDGRKRLIYDLELVCWEGTHLKWALFFWTPMFVCWVIGIPVVTVGFLASRRNQVHSKSFNKYFLVLYQGLRKERYFWEICNILRKVTLLSINVFVPENQVFYKAALGILLLVSFL